MALTETPVMTFNVKSDTSKGHKIIKDSELEDINYKFPDYGPLNIHSHKHFLEFSKNYFKAHYQQSEKCELTLTDFEIIRVLGKGTFGSVVIVSHIHKNKEYAMKIISKAKVVKLKQVQQTYREKLVLEALNSPFTIYLVYFFMNNSYLYYVLPYIKGGELYEFLCKFGRFDEAQAKFYLAQIVLALEYLHSLDLVYRDLKPENIILDHTGYLKLVDFGFSKKLKKGRTYTLCGTPEYMAPEIILNTGHGTAADWWATGVLVYELVAGRSPFHHPDKLRIYEKIVTNTYNVNDAFSDDLKDLVKHFLQVDLTRRLGNMRGRVNDVKHHRWFRTINWLAILNRKITPNFIPELSDDKTSKFMPLPTLKIDDEDQYADIFDVFNKPCESLTKMFRNPTE